MRTTTAWRGTRHTVAPRAAAISTLGLLVLAQLPLAHGYDNGVAVSPPMGWNSWNHFGGGVSAEVLATTAAAFVEAGLRDAGYTWINTDDCWSELARDKATGRIVPAKSFGGTEARLAILLGA
jgi:alpha-galactosidase